MDRLELRAPMISIDKQGYMVIPRPLWLTGYSSKRVREHVIVACQSAGITRLPPGHNVHHIDCNKLNNESINLIIVSSGNHNRIHHQMRVF